MQWGFLQFLSFSWTTLKGKHCRQLFAVMGVRALMDAEDSIKNLRNQFSSRKSHFIFDSQALKAITFGFTLQKILVYRLIHCALLFQVKTGGVSKVS